MPRERRKKINLYRVLGREIIGKGRKGKYIVEISRHWPKNVRRIYLIGEFTNWFPGFIRLRKIGDRGYIVLKLWPGEYLYGFVLDKDLENIVDPENKDTGCIRPFYDTNKKICLSKLIVKSSKNPLENIVHDEKDSSFIHIFNDYLIIRLRTVKELENPILLLNDYEYKPATKYEYGTNITYEYHVKANDLPRTLTYKFILEYRNKTLEYGDEGVGENSSYIVVDKNTIETVNEPKWWMGTVYYQIFVDSFENGDPTNDPEEKIKRIVPRERGYYGGDLRGIINKFTYIKDLGIETLYLTPIFHALNYHRYDVCDYYTIDPYLGDLNDFKELVELIHKNDMRIVIDVPLHHTGSCFEYFMRAIRGEQKYREWYCFTTWNDYEGFFNVLTMPKINHDNIETLKYFENVLKYWIDHGVDGFRIDVGLGILHWWLKTIYYRIKEYNEDILFLGELSDNPVYYKEYFDTFMDYYWRKHVLWTLVERRESLKELVEALNSVYSSLPHYQIVSLYHSLGTHDTPRIKTIVKNDQKTLKILFVLLFVLPGSPAIYYGDEIGLEGGLDPDNRRPMIWDKDKWDLDLLAHVKKLVKLYREHKALRIGFFYSEIIDENMLFIKRWWKEETILTYINLGKYPSPIKLNNNAYYYDLYNEEELETDNVYLGEREFLMLRRLK